MAKVTNKMADAAVAKVSPSSCKMPDERRWKAESAMSTIMRAQEHMADPDTMKDVQKLAKDQMKKLAVLGDKPGSADSGAKGKAAAKVDAKG